MAAANTRAGFNNFLAVPAGLLIIAKEEPSLAWRREVEEQPMLPRRANGTDGSTCGGPLPAAAAREPRASGTGGRTEPKLMIDLVYILASVAFFAVAAGYVYFCDKI